MDCSPPGSAVHTCIPCPWSSPGKNTGVGSHSLLQGIFLTQGMNPGLLHCRQTLYHLSHQASPRPIKLIRKVLGLEENTNQKFSPALLLPTILCLQFFGFPCFHKAFHSQRGGSYEYHLISELCLNVQLALSWSALLINISLVCIQIFCFLPPPYFPETP